MSESNLEKLDVSKKNINQANVFNINKEKSVDNINKYDFKHNKETLSVIHSNSNNNKHPKDSPNKIEGYKDKDLENANDAFSINNELKISIKESDFEFQHSLDKLYHTAYELTQSYEKGKTNSNYDKFFNVELIQFVNANLNSNIQRFNIDNIVYMKQMFIFLEKIIMLRINYLHNMSKVEIGFMANIIEGNLGFYFISYITFDNFPFNYIEQDMCKLLNISPSHNKDLLIKKESYSKLNTTYNPFYYYHLIFIKENNIIEKLCNFIVVNIKYEETFKSLKVVESINISNLNFDYEILIRIIVCSNKLLYLYDDFNEEFVIFVTNMIIDFYNQNLEQSLSLENNKNNNNNNNNNISSFSSVLKNNTQQFFKLLCGINFNYYYLVDNSHIYDIANIYDRNNDYINLDDNLNLLALDFNPYVLNNFKEVKNKLLNTCSLLNANNKNNNLSMKFTVFNKLNNFTNKLIFGLLDSNILEKRNIGINMLNEFILWIIYNEKIKLNSISINTMNYNLVYNNIKKKYDFILKEDFNKSIQIIKSFKLAVLFNKVYLLNWLVDTKIFEKIFGEKIHEAIILKSGYLLYFLYNNSNLLNLDHIVKIWKYTQDKHESISSSILTLMSNIISFINLDHAMYILKEINSLSFKEYNNSTLKILEAFSNNNNIKTKKNINNTESCRKISDYDSCNKDKELSVSKDNNLIDVNNGFIHANNFKGSVEDIQNVDNIIEEEEFIFNAENQNKKNNYKSYYLKILWNLSNEKNYNKFTNKQLVNKAQKLLVEVLLKPSFKENLAKYMYKLCNSDSVYELVNTNIIILKILLKSIKTKNIFDIRDILPNNIISFIESNVKINNDLKITNNKNNCKSQTKSCINEELNSNLDINSQKDNNNNNNNNINNINQNIENKDKLDNSSNININYASEIISYFNKNYNILSALFHAIIFIKNEVCCLTEEILNSNLKNSSNSLEIINNNDTIKQNNYQYKIDNINNNNINDILNNYDNNNLNKLENLNNKISNNDTTNQDIKKLYNSSELNNEVTNINADNIVDNYNDDIDNEYGDLNNKRLLDETLSTEKSIKNSMSTISTQLSKHEKEKLIIIKEYFDTYKNTSDKGLNTFDFIFNHLKLNYTGDNYFGLLQNILNFVKYLLFNSDLVLKVNYIEFLNCILLKNSVDSNEENIFFDFLSDLIKYQQLTNKTIFSEETLNYIMFEVVLKLKFDIASYEGFQLFRNLLYCFNYMYGNIILSNSSLSINNYYNFNNFNINNTNKDNTISNKFSNISKIDSIIDFNSFIGFETLWMFYNLSNNKLVKLECLAIIVNIINILHSSNNEENKSCYFKLIEKIFGELKDCYNILQDFNNNNNCILYNITKLNLDNNDLTSLIRINKDIDKSKIYNKLQRDIEFNSKFDSNFINCIECIEKINKLVNLIHIMHLYRTDNFNKLKFIENERKFINIGFKDYYTNNDGKLHSLTIDSDKSISIVKLEIAKNILQTNKKSININDLQSKIMLTYKSKVLNNSIKLKDIAYEPNTNINIFEGSNGSDKSNQPSIEEISDMINQMKCVFELEYNLLELALEKNNYKVEDTIIYLTDENNILNIENEIKSNKNVNNKLILTNEFDTNKNINDNQSSSFVNILNDERLSLFKNILALNVLLVNKGIWNFLYFINFSDEYIQSIINPCLINLNEIFTTQENIDNFINVDNSKNFNNFIVKLIINLKLISTAIFNEKYFINTNKLEDSKCLEWKTNFIIIDGTTYLTSIVKLLLDRISKNNNNYYSMYKNNYKANISSNGLLNKTDEHSILNTYNSIVNNMLNEALYLIIKIIHYFCFSSAISLSSNKELLSNAIKIILNNRPYNNVYEINYPNHSSKHSTPSLRTPNFGSPHTSFEANSNNNISIINTEQTNNFNKENKNKNNVNNSVISNTNSQNNISSISYINMKNQYDNFDEDLSTSYFSKLIHYNFYKNVLSYFQIISINSGFNNKSIESEKIFYIFLEIHSILSEIDPQYFKEYLANEIEGNLLLKFLYYFNNTPKHIRKLIEITFTIISNSNNYSFIYKEINKSVDNIANKNKIFKEKNVSSSKEALLLHIANNFSKRDVFCEEYFNIFGYLLKNINKVKIELNNILDIHNLLCSIITIFINDNNKKKSNINQEQLSGYFNILECSCYNHKQNLLKCISTLEKEHNINLIDILYDNLFVFEEDKIGQNEEMNKKCPYFLVKYTYNNIILRHRAFNFLLSLSKLNEDYKNNLVFKLSKHHNSFDINNNYLKQSEVEINTRNEEDRFVGLKNYGATCYFNSIIQQLFMISDIKEKIYSIDFSKQFKDFVSDNIEKSYNILNNNNKYNINNTVDANLQKEIYTNFFYDTIFENCSLFKNELFQTQYLFVNLENTVKQYHTPINLINSFSQAFNNQPIDVRVQQDSEEFLNIFVDRIENLSNNKSFFNDIFKVEVSNTIISLDESCPYFSETITPCNSISLDIKNRNNLKDAFNYYIKEEILDGDNKYYIEKYNKKVPILRRISIKKLSKIVIVHLKRFDFDYISFEKIKLNSYLEFPKKFDFSDYYTNYILEKSKDELYMKNIDKEINSILNQNDNEIKNENFKYEICGILLHSGTSLDAGHYLSYIKSNNDWYEFDDSKVTKISEEKAFKDSFGEDKENNSDHESNKNNYFKRSTNAYMLFYRQKEINNEKINNSNEDKNINTSKYLSCTYNKNNNCFNNSIWIKEIFKKVHYNNKYFIKLKAYINNDYYNFLKSFFEYNILGKNKTFEKLNATDDSLSIDLKKSEFVSKKVLKHLESEKLDYKNSDNYNKIYNLLKKEKENLDNLLKEQEIKNNGTVKNNPANKILSLIKDNNKYKYLLPKKQTLKCILINIAVYYYFDIIIIQNDKSKLNQYSAFLKELLETTRERCCWILKELINNQNTFKELIFINQSVDIRDSFYKILTFCLNTVIQDELIISKNYITLISEKYIIDSNKQIKTYTLENIPVSSVIRFYKYNILNLFDESRKYWIKNNQYMSLILDLINYKFPQIIKISIQENFFNKLLYYILNNSIQEYKTGFNKMGNMSEPNMTIPINILSEYICSFVTQGVYNLKKYSIYSIYQGEQNIIDFPEEYYSIVNKEIFNYIFKRYSNESTKKIIHHLSWGIESISYEICYIMVECIKDNFNDSSGLINLLINLYGIIEINDVYVNDRISIIFGLRGESLNINKNGILDCLIINKDVNIYPVLLVLKFWADMFSKNKDLYIYFVNNNDKLIWISELLNKVSNDIELKEILQIECAGDNLNLKELLKYIKEKYINYIRIKELMF